MIAERQTKSGSSPARRDLHPASGRGARPLRSGLAAALMTLAALIVPVSHAGTPVEMTEHSWRLDSSGDGIALYRGEVTKSGIVPSKVVMSIPGTIAEVSLVLEDIPRRREWVSNLDRSVLLERTNDYDQKEYLRVAVPWPASDRSAVIRALVTVSDDLRQATIAAQSVDLAGPDSLPRLVRATVHASTFQMTQVGDDVDVVAYIYIDPAGSVPKWIVNYFSRRVARATLNGLRRQVARRLYTPEQVVAMQERMHRYREFRAGR